MKTKFKPTKLDILSLAISLLIMIFMPGCSDNSSGPSDGGPFSKDQVTYDVVYQDNVVILTGTRAGSFKSVDTSGTVYIFDQAALGELPKEGQVVVVDKKVMFKVSQITPQGGEVIINGEPAKLTDVIKSGRISWEFTPKAEMLGKALFAGKDTKMEKTQTGFEYKYEFGHNKYTIYMDPKGTSESGLPELQVNFTVETLEGVGGVITALFGAKGTTRLPHQSATIDIANGQVTNFNSSNKGLRSELTLEYIASFSPGGGTTALTFPNLTMRVPIQALTSIPIPIPIYITLGLAFNTYINLPEVNAFATAKVKMIIDSEAGFQFQGPTVNPVVKLGTKDIGECTWEVGDMSMAPVGVEIQNDVFVPRIGIEIAGQEIAWVSSVLSSRSKLIIPSLCKAQMTQIRLDGGYGFSILGYPLFEGYKVFWEMDKTYKTPECP